MESAFTKRLPSNVVEQIVAGQLLAQLENGQILENPQAFRESSGDYSLRGSVGKQSFSWPACGCGVRVRVRAIPKP